MPYHFLYVIIADRLQYTDSRDDVFINSRLVFIVVVCALARHETLLLDSLSSLKGTSPRPSCDAYSRDYVYRVIILWNCTQLDDQQIFMRRSTCSFYSSIRGKKYDKLEDLVTWPLANRQKILASSLLLNAEWVISWCTSAAFCMSILKVLYGEGVGARCLSLLMATMIIPQYSQQSSLRSFLCRMEYCVYSMPVRHLG